MPRETKRQRNAKQMIRQQRVREKARLRRRPDRDDLARVLLWQMIEVARQEDDSLIALGKVRDVIVELLERQGFNVFESEDVFHELADSYADGLFPFRPKRHLETN